MSAKIVLGRMTKGPSYWLMKTEPEVFSIADLEKAGKAQWEGVRNYQARNFMRAMKMGDRALIYHSNCDPKGVAGVGRITGEAVPDHYSLDSKSDYYDPRSTPENPIWVMVQVAFVERFPRLVTLEQMKSARTLQGMMVTRKGHRLSIQPVSKPHFEEVLRLGRERR